MRGVKNALTGTFLHGEAGAGQRLIVTWREKDVITADAETPKFTHALRAS
jgi:hypothetical protein